MDTTLVERWRSKERELGFEDLETEMLQCGSVILPSEAAPFLDFEQALNPSPVWAVFGSLSDWPAPERERLAPYRMIGSDGAGNPICIDSGTDAILLLDHEDRFRTHQFVNSGVRELAECLLAYMGEKQSERFRLAVQEIDPPALSEGSFWWHEVAGLVTDA